MTKKEYVLKSINKVFVFYDDFFLMKNVYEICTVPPLSTVGSS